MGLHGSKECKVGVPEDSNKSVNAKKKKDIKDSKCMDRVQKEFGWHYMWQKGKKVKTWYSFNVIQIILCQEIETRWLQHHSNQDMLVGDIIYVYIQ